MFTLFDANILWRCGSADGIFLITVRQLWLLIAYVQRGGLERQQAVPPLGAKLKALQHQCFTHSHPTEALCFLDFNLVKARVLALVGPQTAQ